jgi:arginase
MVEFVCIGVPYFIGERIPANNAVDILRASGIADELGAAWVDVKPDFASAPDAVTAVNQALAATLKAHSGKFPLVFAGDCTMCIGVTSALAAHQPAIVWLDAHGDFNTNETTLSNFLGGMPLAALVGRDNQHWLQGVNLAPIAETDVIISDARDLDPQEGVNLRASDLTLLPNISDLLTAPLPDKPLYIHLDLDVVHLDDMPAVSYPATGGSSVTDIIAALRRILRDGQVICVLFTLWKADLPGADTAHQSTLHVVRAIAAELNA